MALALALAATACGGNDLTLPAESVAAKIVVLGGDKQSGTVGGVLGDSIAVRVTDSKDRPVQNQKVSFTPGANSGTVVPPSPSTDANGRAAAAWLLGDVAGAQTVVAKPTGNGAPANLSATFTATAAASPPARVAKSAGDGQTANAGSEVAVPPAVKVTDANDNPVAGVAVTFAVTGGGGSVAPITPVKTNANGVASATSWRLGVIAGRNTLTATAAGTGPQGNPATFIATGTIGISNKLVFVVQPSNATVGAAITPAVKVQVQDAAGNVVTGASNQITVALGSNATGASLGGTTTVSAVNGTATFANLTVNRPGTGYTLTALASGLVSAESNAFNVAGGSTTTNVTVPAGATVVGQAYTVSFSVNPVPPASGTPTGSVTVSDGAGATCQASAPSGSCSLLSTTAGVKTVTASYSGDGTFSPSISAGAAHQVNQATTTTVIASDTPDPSVFGQSITVSYTLTVNGPGSGDPAGNVVVALQGAGGCTGTVAAGQCSFVPTAVVASANLTAAYQGSADFAGSTSSPRTHTVSAASTTTMVTTSKTPSDFGESVTFTATVAAAAPGAGTPTGNVQFQIDGSNSGSPVALSSGKATLTTSTLAPGTHTVSASYAGTASFKSSSGSLTGGQTVGAAGTNTSVSSSNASSVFGEGVTFTATVSGSGGTPGGTVTFKDNATCASGTGTIASASLNGAGTASSGAIGTLSVGAHTIRACYAGSGSFGPSEGTTAQLVGQASTTTTITGFSPEPSTVGSAVTVTFTVVVNAPGAGTPTGTVNVSTDGTESCSASVQIGQCDITFTASGTRQVTATYAGDGNFSTSAATEPHLVTP
ncbi:MAG TPA: Ig-like domain repeat protein [Gemmatimonadales bacterium]|nr:Ig-like domain repeat protein [Gemmatimonadales bacterium]